MKSTKLSINGSGIDQKSFSNNSRGDLLELQNLPNLRMLWICFVCLETAMLAATIYCLISCLCHTFVRLKREKDKGYRNPNLILLFFVVMYTLTACAKYSLAQAVTYMDPDPHLCALFTKASRTLHVIGFTFLTLFLWFRQRILYDLSQLKHLADKCTIWWSRITLLMIVVSSGAGVGIILSTTINQSRYRVHENQCINIEEKLSVSALSGVISNCVVQVSLLILFVRFIGKRELSSSSSFDKKTKLLVRRCCLVTSICVTTDLLAIAIVTFIKGQVPELITILILDLDQFVNLSCILLCFLRWKEILFPWPVCGCSKKKEKKQSSEFLTAVKITTLSL
ncbi:unnamed protein product [Clavelina lepadiformis]|uniref:Uncharacterized protein n=1 Tax=Clavelina lepadiformis TaxID=159417 RepID=A0ABP0FYN7_CLALP